MSKDSVFEISVNLVGGDLESVTVKQPRLTVNFLLQQSALATQGDADSYFIGQAFLFAAEMRRPNGDKLFDDYEQAMDMLHFSSTKTLFKMMEENEDMKEILKEAGSHKNKHKPDEGEPEDPKL